jgi:hypothetical protein
MRSALRASALSSFIMVSTVAGAAHAITDPAQSPQQPPPNGAVVMGQPGQPGQPVQLQQPPPQRMGVWLQARAGGGIEFLGGTRGNAFASVAGGYVLPQGIGFTVYGGGRYLFAPICDSVSRCTGPAGSGVLDIEIGLVLRYTALPDARLHPVGEIGGQVHILPAPNAFGIGYGGQVAAGIEFDLTASLSFDVLARAQLLVAGWDNRSAISDMLGVRIEPVLGLTYYF